MIRIYDSNYRGECRSERCEQIDAMGWLEHNHPERWPLIWHSANEASGRGSSHLQMRVKEGVKSGVPDIVDAGAVRGFFEMKRVDRTKSKVEKSQKDFLIAADATGAFTAIVYGFDQFKLAYSDYLDFIAERQLT